QGSVDRRAAGRARRLGPAYRAWPRMDALDRHHAAPAAGEKGLRRQRQEPTCVHLSGRGVARTRASFTLARFGRRTLRRRRRAPRARLCRAAPLLAGRISALSGHDRRAGSQARKARTEMNTVQIWLGQNTLAVALMV